MDLIRIDDNKLKIMLTPVDMQCYALDDTMDYTKDETRQAFRSIMSEVRSRTGFDAEGNRVYVQLYPSRSGGCEMFVTKLDIVCAADRAKQSSTTQGAARITAQPQPLRLGSAEGGRNLAFAFAALEHLLCVCRRLYACAFDGNSAAYHSEDGRYYLLLGERGGHHQPLLFDRAALSFLNEYGTQQNADAVRLYIREHGRPICETDAVARLAVL